MDIFNNLKECIYNNINTSKKIINDENIKKNEINKKILSLEKFLSTIKKPNDLNKAQNKKNYYSNIMWILLSEADNYADYLCSNNKYDTMKNNIELFKNNSDNNENVLILTKDIISYLKNKMKMYNNDISHKFRNKSKDILSIIENEEYKNNISAINKIINYMKEDTNLSLDEIEKICLYMCDEYEKYLKIKREKNEIVDKIQEEDKIEVKENVTEKIEKEKIQKQNIFDIDDRVLIEEINKIIFYKKDELKYLNKEYINTLEENSYSLDDNDKYKAELILYYLDILLKKIFKIQNRINNKENLTPNQLHKYIYLKDKIMIKIQNLYIEYSNLNNNEDKKEEKNTKKNLIYLTNENDNLYFEYDKIDREYCPSFLKMIDELENGIIHNNITKDGNYTSNKKLKGIMKKKKYKSRIMYILHKDYIFVLTLFTKKSNSDEYLSNYMANIAMKTRPVIKQIKKDLEDPIKREQIINKNKEINENIKNTLESKTKSQKKLTLK